MDGTATSIAAEATGKGVLDPERFIPPPITVSAQAQAFLAQRMPAAEQPNGTADKAAWKAYITESNGWLTAHMEASAAAFPARYVIHELDSTPLYEIIPDGMAEGDAGRIIFYIHGGAFIHGAGPAGAYMAMPLACTAGLKTFCVDYRMPPDHPFPVGLEDAVSAYRHVLQNHDPAKIAIAGGSAGGGLAGSLILKLRDLGLPMPAACVLATPEADLTEAGDTFETNHYADVVLQGRLTDSIALYADGHDLKDPYLSPLFGDFTKGFPPTILTSGTRDAFLSNTVLMHRALLRAGVEAELHVWEAMPHGGFFGAPEDREVVEQQARFIRKHLA